jgi:hypothetical protein
VTQKLNLGFVGEGFARGVPVTTVADKLNALQNLLFHAAATVARDRMGRSGMWSNRYRDAVELGFSAAHHSDLVIEAALPSVSAVAGELGEKAVDLVFAAGAMTADAGDLRDLVGDREERLFLLRAFEALCPAPAEGYRIELTNCRPERGKLVFSVETRERIKERIVRERTPIYSAEETTVVGVLIRIEVVSPQRISLLVTGESREVHCYFGDGMRDQISNLLAGSIVEVTGLPVYDAEEHLLRIDTITDVETVSMESVRLTRFEHEGRLYRLIQPIVVDVEYSEGVWIYHNELFSLWGYARRRADAVKELHEAFDYLWREIAMEDDDALDEKARALKALLLSRVDRSPQGE